jgi:2-hydroxy-3-keto-5-methylthiopentenyl-1-phosphate phosphatase
MTVKCFTKGEILILCDFDGTVCTVDMGNEVLNRFTDERWDEIDRAYCADEIGSRFAYSNVSTLFRGTKSQILEFVINREKIDPYFTEFYFFCRERGFDLKIVSDGLDIYIDAILKKNNLHDIEFFSNVAVFQGDDGLSVEFPRMNEQCEKCGTCKSGILEEHRSGYNRVIYVGNGHSDVCPAKSADIVFAKDVLYEKLMKSGMACVYFENFKDVHDFIKKDILD